jgi:hypothetical protein
MHPNAMQYSIGINSHDMIVSPRSRAAVQCAALHLGIVIVIAVTRVSCPMQVDDETRCASLDPALVVADRLFTLSGFNLVRLGPNPILIQFMGDACGLWKSTHTSGTSVVIKVIYNDKGVTVEGRGVNTVANNSLLTWWVGDDTHDSMTTAASGLPGRLDAMVRDGVKVDTVGEHGEKGPSFTQPVALCVGGDMKFMSSMMGLCGCSSTFPCIHCNCTSSDLALSAAAWAAKDGIKLRTYETQLQLAHTLLCYEYNCPGCNLLITPGGNRHLPTTETHRLKYQKEHSGTRPGHAPMVRLCVNACMCLPVLA